MLEFAQRLAVFDHGQVIGKQDVNRAADRRHLQLDGVEPQLLHRASATNAAVADESDRLIAPFSVGVVGAFFKTAVGPRLYSAAVKIKASNSPTFFCQRRATSSFDGA